MPAHPDEAWVAEQAEAFVQQARGQGLRIRYLTHDRDTKFTAGFDQALDKRRITVIKSPKCAPNCNAFVERFIGSLRWECLDHFLFFGLTHLDSVARSFLEHYLCERPHQGKENDLLTGATKRLGKPPPDEPSLSLREIHCEQRLGGLLKHYYRKAA